MSWVKSKALLAAGVISLAMLGAPGTAKAGIVVASSGPSASSYPAGKKLPDNTRITLRAGDSITILDGGRTRILRGEGTFTIGSSAARRRAAAFGAFNRTPTRSRTGAVRTGETDQEVRSPNIWYVDVNRPGKICVFDAETLFLWRPDTEKEAQYTVKAEDGSMSGNVTFPVDYMVAELDTSTAPVTDGSTWKIGRSGGGAPGEFVLSVLPEKPESAEDLAEALIGRGCDIQLELLTTTLPASES